MNLRPAQTPTKPGTADAPKASPVWPSRFLFITFLICLGMLLGYIIGTSSSHSSRTAPMDASPAGELPQRQVITGPWGTLEILRIEIERPDEYISTAVPAAPPSRWFFGELTADQLRQVMSGDDLTKEQQAALLDPHKWEITTNGVFVTPGTDVILSLSPDARGRIYGILATNGVNLEQQWALRLRADSVDEWFDQSGLQPATVQLIRHLLYREGSALCFSDLDEAMSCISTDAEKRQLIKLLSRQAAVVARLRVDEGQDIEPLVAYWGRQGRAKDVRPLLRALARTPGGDSLDITHLLPPFARKVVYTYPAPSDDPLISRRDCAWTSMNFFNDEPEGQFYDFAVTQKILNRDYHPTQDAPIFGDIVFVSRNGSPLHLAVYIADDILFSKNGASFTEPWVLVEMKDMLADYDSGQPLQVITYRRNQQ